MSDAFRVDLLPPYLLGSIAQAVIAARVEGRDVVDLSQVNPSLSVSPDAIDKLIESALRPQNHRYSASQGIARLRNAVCGLYERRFGVELCSSKNAVAVMGVKEGLAHLLLAMLRPGDHVVVPTPGYPIHTAAVAIAGAGCCRIPLVNGDDLPVRELSAQNEIFFRKLEQTCSTNWPNPRVLLLSFPHNPTGIVVTRDFFERIVSFARERNMYIIHDFAYADIVFDGFQAPSILEVPGALECAVEFYSMSKAYNVGGWRVGFCLGAEKLISALKKIKSYLDCGIFQPLQIAAAHMLENSDSVCAETSAVYQSRRDVLVGGLQELGWEFNVPKATLFVWSKIPKHYRELRSNEFCHQLLSQVDVAACPGIGFDAGADEYVRFALMENEVRLRLALRRFESWDRE